jgi:2-oxoglutarate dehydrogenase E1 component
MTDRPETFAPANAAYVEAMHRQYLEDPASVPEDWRLFLAGFELASRSSPAAGSSAGVFGLVAGYREFGHLIARLDPLGERLETHPLLELENFGLTPADLDRELDPRPFRGEFRGTLAQLIEALRETYCGTLGVEYTDIPDKRRRDWLEERMERRRNRPELSADERVRILEWMLQADAFEAFAHARYPGQKRFSLEGAATLVPMLDALIEAVGSLGGEQLVLGMPHRGRLNVLANVLGKPLERVFAEFESSFKPSEIQDQGDVKYHLGYSSQRDTRAGRTLSLSLHYNPSHLEFVNPVVLGSVRARQAAAGDSAHDRGWPMLIHGEAAFAGEGIVAETLTLAQLPGYEVGGTVHVILDNQVGFTTSPAEGRPTRYPTDIARVIEAPVLHVNGDDPETAVHAVRLAAAYRAEFHRDVFLHLVCYRRYGHNELDDPTFTQPLMYRAIAEHTPASVSYAERLVREGVVDEATVRAMQAEIAQRLNAAHRRAASPLPPEAERGLGGAWEGLAPAPPGVDWSAATAVSRGTLEQVARSAAVVPPEFEAHPKAAKLLADRVAMVEEDRVDWGCAEVLAFGTLLLEGYHVRLSGQDTGRGTFSHRHAVLHDQRTGATQVPLQHLAPGQGRFEVINSPLDEAASLGYEYGYSAADPHTLVIWEAQFGDFANVAQVVIDQFVASSEAKWSRMSGLTLLLPHGYEGQGPEHSSARLERFLELCAMGNMQVCNLTTPAQLFHALRRQLHRPFRKPLVIMSPKSLLRHRLAVSPIDAFTSEGFRSVIDDRAVPDPATVETVLLVSGRFAYVLAEAREAHAGARVAIVRVEQLYPFPRGELAAAIARYPNAREIRWVQEEPANMGAWRHLRHRLEGILPEGVRLCMIARKAVPAPATGYYPLHVEEERLLVERSFGKGSGAMVDQVEAPEAARGPS